ncbi:PREDICTED: uncharacterized protein LOC104827277 [Tarenaya hassleriana]|uniref:uncharacterized protein LOC104827277 n=1 Tax=Tarenaya hassleriana TaxID=28532 RepID=UPI00053C2E94|nr:PREDICTED: uncharacterized protein LOC104827277 [Tarenaya hassleriana]
MGREGERGYYNNRKNGQIPRFGEWEDANEMPITQYFEDARQAGLLRENNTRLHTSSSSSAETLKLHSRCSHARPLPKQTALGAAKDKRGPQQRVRDVIEKGGKQYAYVSEPKQYQNVVGERPPRAPKPIDEDLYKIPPEFLHPSKKKKMPGLFSCLVPCAS